MNNQILHNESFILTPRQPLWILATEHYYKVEIMKYGISHFYTFYANSDLINYAQVIPDGVVDLIFRCRGNKPEAFGHGTFLKACNLNDTTIIKKDDIIFGVRFLPGQAYLPGGFPMSELTDQSVDLADIFQCKDMVERIAESENFQDQIAIFMHEYRKGYQQQKIYNSSEKELFIYIAEQILKSRGTIKLEELSEQTYFSTRYLNKLFHREYGMSPKFYAQIIRLQNILEQLRYPENLPISHMIPDFLIQHI